MNLGKKIAKKKAVDEEKESAGAWRYALYYPRCISNLLQYFTFYCTYNELTLCCMSCFFCRF